MDKTILDDEQVQLLSLLSKYGEEQQRDILKKSLAAADDASDKTELRVFSKMRGGDET